MEHKAADHPEPLTHAPKGEEAAALPGTRRHDDAHHGVLSAVRVVAGVTFISRLGGLFRDGALSRVLGDGAVSSAFNFAFMIPNVFRRLFGEGALTAAFIPEYASIEQKDPAKANRFASLTVVLAVSATTALTLLLEAGLVGVMFLAPQTEERRLMLALTMLMLPFMPLVCIAAVFAGMLQTHNRFGVSTAGPIILNLVIIATTAVAYMAFSLSPEQTAYVAGVGVVVSGLALAVSFVAALRRHVRWTTDFSGVRENATRMLRRFIPALIGLGALQLSSVIDGLIATYSLWFSRAGAPATFLGLEYPLDSATNGILAYTQRLYQFPLGVFGIAVATAVFPALARAAEDKALFTAMLRRGLRLSLFISLPASVGLVLVGEDLSRALFRGVNFGEDGVRRSAAILTGYAVSVWAFSANQVLTRAFFARGDTKTPVWISVKCIAINLVGNLTLIWIPGVGEAAFGWSTAASSFTQFVLLVRASRKFMDGGKLLDSSAMRGGGATLDYTLVMGFFVIATLAAMPSDTSIGWTVARLVVCAGGGAALYFGVARWKRCEELTWLLSRGLPGAAAREGDERPERKDEPGDGAGWQ